MKGRTMREDGLDAYRRQAWLDAYEILSKADAEEALPADDLEVLATAAYLVGKDEESVDAWTRAHHLHLQEDAPARAARAAYWLAVELNHKGDRARGGGWIARARRLLDECGRDCVERGYLELPRAMRAISEGDYDTAYDAFCRATDIGERFGDPDLTTLGRHGRGRVLMRRGRIDEGLTLLDEAMVAVHAGEVSPLVVGDVYCSVIEACREIFDLGRAREWTAALTYWCEAHDELVPYRGQCLVRRAEIMQLHGEWSDAADEAERACRRLSEPPGEPAAGAAYYQRAELHRLRGAFEEAEEAYRLAVQWGRAAQPGLALLRAAQGRLDAAKAGIRRALDEAKDRRSRSTLLPPCVHIMLAGGEPSSAREAADELAEIAEHLDVPWMRALAAHAEGAVLLAEDATEEALHALRDAWSIWEELEAPYEATQVRVLIAQGCRRLGDEDGARLELEAARWTFERLGATPDVARVDALIGEKTTRPTGGLTTRQVEVLRLVAAGKTNRAIAEELFISEKTVARHVSNIFSRLDVSTRAAATAYAFRHGIVEADD